MLLLSASTRAEPALLVLFFDAGFPSVHEFSLPNIARRRGGVIGTSVGVRARLVVASSIGEGRGGGVPSSSHSASVISLSKLALEAAGGTVESWRRALFTVGDEKDRAARGGAGRSPALKLAYPREEALDTLANGSLAASRRDMTVALGGLVNEKLPELVWDIRDPLTTNFDNPASNDEAAVVNEAAEDVIAQR